MNIVLIDHIERFIAKIDCSVTDRCCYSKSIHSFTATIDTGSMDDLVPVPQIHLGDLYRDYVDIRGIAYQLPEKFPDGSEGLVQPGRICWHLQENLAKESDLICCVESWARNPRRHAENDLHTYLHFRVLSLIRRWALENGLIDIKIVHPYDPERGSQYIDFEKLWKTDERRVDEC